jgi:hypothetical protein
MILGSQARNRPEATDHRDRGRFLSPRLYPSAPFEPWQPVASSEQPDAEQPDAEQPDAEQPDAEQPDAEVCS